MKNSERVVNNPKLAYSVYFASFALLLATLIIRCRYGFANIDESFYLAVPHRLIQGDGLFVQEWNLSQMTGLLLYPFVWMYEKIFNTTDGMVLFFRYLYLAFQSITALFLFFRCRKINFFGSFFASLLFLIFAPFGVMALSYNSMAIMALSAAAVIMLTSKRLIYLQYIIAGVLLSIAVLGCPFLVLLFVIYTVFVFARSIIHRKNNADVPHSAYRIKSWLAFTCGVCVAAALFVLFVLSRNSLSDVLSSFKYIFQDPEHSGESFFSKIISYYLILPYAAAYALILIVYAFDKKRKNHRHVYFTIALLTTLPILAFIVIATKNINRLMLPVTFAGLAGAVLYFDDQVIRKVFSMIWIPGIIYSFCINLGSNQKILVMGSACTVSAFASVLIIGYILKNIESEALSKKKIITACAVLVLSCQLVSVLGFRMYYVFFANPINEQKYLINEGFEKNIYVQKHRYEDYQQLIGYVEKIKAEGKNADSILYFTNKPYLYMMTPQYTDSSFSPWLYQEKPESSADRLVEYYKLNPFKTPDLIYAEAEQDSAVATITMGEKYNKIKLSDEASLYVREK